MLIGTFCTFSATFCAVTVMPPSSCALRCSVGAFWLSVCADVVAWSSSAASANAGVKQATWMAAASTRRLKRGVRFFVGMAFLPRLREEKNGASSVRSRCLVVVERGSERRLQRIEPRFVAAPLIDAARIDRLAHLLGARGADGPVVVEKVETRVFERQAAVVEQPPHLACR